jgi:hypothetical protein
MFEINIGFIEDDDFTLFNTGANCSSFLWVEMKPSPISGAFLQLPFCDDV